MHCYIRKERRRVKLFSLTPCRDCNCFYIDYIFQQNNTKRKMATSKLCYSLFQKFIAYASKFLNILIITLFVQQKKFKIFYAFLVFMLLCLNQSTFGTFNIAFARAKIRDYGKHSSVFEPKCDLKVLFFKILSTSLSIFDILLENFVLKCMSRYGVQLVTDLKNDKHKIFASN